MSELIDYLFDTLLHRHLKAKRQFPGGNVGILGQGWNLNYLILVKEKGLAFSATSPFQGYLASSSSQK